MPFSEHTFFNCFKLYCSLNLLVDLFVIRINQCPDSHDTSIGQIHICGFRQPIFSKESLLKNCLSFIGLPTSSSIYLFAFCFKRLVHNTCVHPGKQRLMAALKADSSSGVVGWCDGPG